MIKRTGPKVMRMMVAASFILFANQMLWHLPLSRPPPSDPYADAPSVPSRARMERSKTDTPFAQYSTAHNDTSAPKHKSQQHVKDKWKPLPWSLPSVPPNQKSSIEFMSELNELKRSMNIPLPWETSDPLPTPIFNFNLPKSATLTSSEFFRCGGIASSHTFVPFTSYRIGDCIRENFLAEETPFKGCDRNNKTDEVVEFYSDFGIQGPHCFYSSLHDGGLEHIAKYYPNATIFMLLRSAASWYKSASNWGEGRLLKAFKNRCGFLPLGNTTQEDWEYFYNAHTEKLRQYALKNLHITYVEVELNEEAGEIMEVYTGINSTCLMHCYPGPPKDPNVDLKTYTKCQPVVAPS